MWQYIYMKQIITAFVWRDDSKIIYYILVFAMHTGWDRYSHYDMVGTQSAGHSPHMQHSHVLICQNVTECPPNVLLLHKNICNKNGIPYKPTIHGFYMFAEYLYILK